MLAGSRVLRDRLRAWALDDERLDFDNSDQLVAAAQRRDAASWAERDQVLDALLDRATDDALARRVALQVVLPGLKSLRSRVATPHRMVGQSSIRPPSVGSNPQASM